MPQGVKVSTDLRQAIIRMADFKLNHTLIEMYTGISLSQVNRFIATHRKTGTVEAPLAAETRGRPRIMDDISTAVSSSKAIYSFD